ncbi:VOC family protein [Rhizobium sp. 18055]|jgi:catechol 2,3-dioxygenase-like lactoylglutathione lyase family enzyme|uniref:VOC family protein n=1 Tax=Rhizobium sp. 18055 TaxID=2681403 RepID=UPI00135A2768|nr:VOC family protein [Rhizobium sp. 18055]
MMLHHVSIVVSDLSRSIAFYRDVFGLEQIERPPFSSEGAWFSCGGQQVHLILNPAGTFRPRPTIDTTDTHFAFRTDDFEAAIHRLESHGFREDAEEGDPWRLRVRRKGPAGFPQAYLLDPDRNIIEVNGAA